MVGLAERVDPIECAHPLEAQVRELRLIAAYKPRYNRRSKFPERAVWLKLTNEPFPRLSVVHAIRLDGAAYLGPLRSVRQAEAVRDAIHDAVPLRQCTDRLSVRRAVRAACVLAGIGRCSAPCQGGQSPEAYAALAELVRAAWSGDVRPLVDPLRARLARLAAAERFEHAACRQGPDRRCRPGLRAHAANRIAHGHRGTRRRSSRWLWGLGGGCHQVRKAGGCGRGGTGRAALDGYRRVARDGGRGAARHLATWPVAIRPRRGDRVRAEVARAGGDSPRVDLSPVDLSGFRSRRVPLIPGNGRRPPGRGPLRRSSSVANRGPARPRLRLSGPDGTRGSGSGRSWAVNTTIGR